MTPYRVCLVCLGNICRSPIAEVVLRDRLERAGLGEVVQVDSAGTGSWHAGEPADPRARAALRRQGLDGDQHRARQIERGWFARYDLVLALDAGNAADLRRLAPTPEDAAKVRLLRSYEAPSGHAGGSDLDVPDPYYGGDAGFDAVVVTVARAADGLVAELAARLVGRPGAR